MITKNGKILIGMATVAQGSRSYGVAVTKPDGTTVYCRAYNISNLVPSRPLNIRNNTFNSGFVIGSGTTAATENDYWLESQITTGFTGGVMVGNQTRGAQLDDNGNPKARYILTVQNTSSNSMTIGEIGCAYNPDSLYPAESGGSSVNSALLTFRTVLDTPVVIPAGETKSIVYEEVAEVM